VFVLVFRTRTTDTKHETPRLASEILLSSLHQSLSIKTAKQIGLTIPPNVLLRADKGDQINKAKACPEQSRRVKINNEK
jgi:hypothetical protein